MFDDEEDTERDRLTGGRSGPSPKDLQAALAARRNEATSSNNLPAGAIHHIPGTPGASTMAGVDDEADKKAAMKLEKIAVDTIQGNNAPGSSTGNNNTTNNSGGNSVPSGTAGDEVVVARASVPYSDVFPVKERQVGPHHFIKLKLLGRGGIGQVYLVQLRNTDKLYAMKVLTKDEMIQRNKVKRVMTEREILATANHPFIVTMYASFQTNVHLCFVMEYCAGGEFFRVLQRQPRRRLKESAVRFYAAEVILALEYLHHMGFIYRDLKPENILMRENGHISLTDFDLSKQAHPVAPRIIQTTLSFSDKIRKSFSMKPSGSSLATMAIVNSEPVLPYRTNSFVGTEEYIAPEVVNGVSQSSAVDWWTLGILIYEMLTGTTPFKGNVADETFHKIVNNQLKWPDDINVSQDCKTLVKKLLKREPDKRLGSHNGASDIKASRWFKDFNFALIRNEVPPIIPKIKNPKEYIQYPMAPDANSNDGTKSGAKYNNNNNNNSDHENEYMNSNNNNDDSNNNNNNSSNHQSNNSNSYGYDDDNPNNPFANFNIRRDSELLQRQY